jgi:N-acetylglutamate synthase-like GNAT family acetyltransferase
MVQPKIAPCSYLEIEHLVAQAKKERIGITPNTKFYCAKDNEKVMGFCGIVFKRGYAVVKNIYVMPEYRKQGLGEKIIKYQFRVVKQAGYPYALAYCTPMSINIFIKLGAKVIKEYKKSTVVRIDMSEQ